MPIFRFQHIDKFPENISSHFLSPPLRTRPTAPILLFIALSDQFILKQLLEFFYRSLYERLFLANKHIAFMRKVKIKFIPISHIRDFLYTAEIFAFVTFGEASVYSSVDYFYFAKNIAGIVLIDFIIKFRFRRQRNGYDKKYYAFVISFQLFYTLLNIFYRR